MTLSCPICKSHAFDQTDLVIPFPEVLDQWERETATRFLPDTRQDYSNVKESHFFKCKKCGYGAFNPSAAGTSNFYRDITIEGDYYVDDKWEFKKTYEFLRLYKATSLLDYGCGGGSFLRQVQKNFPKLNLCGFDKNPTAAKNFEGAAIAFTSDLALQSDRYDFVTAFQIIEHLDDPLGALKSIKERMNDDGFLVISVPNTEGPIRHFPKALTEVPPHHVTRWTAAALRSYLQNEKFEVLEISYEPLSRILWESYLPVMIKAVLPAFLQKVYLKLKGPQLVLRFIKLLKLTPLKTLPLRGHSVYVLARKCAE